MKYKSIVINSENEVKWLIIESDESDTKGFFVYYYTEEESAYDTWHKSLDDAFDAGIAYGIQKEDWEIIKDE